MKVKTIGKIQLVIGITLFIVVMISSLWFLQNIYRGDLENTLTTLTTTWHQLGQTLNATTITENLGKEHLIGYVSLEMDLFKTSFYLFVASIANFLFLSIILILEGLANISNKR